MGGTIGYDKNGSQFPPEEINHDSYEAPKSKPYGFDQGHTNTSNESASDVSSDVSPVFAEADEFFANTNMPEGALQTPELDPAATGEEAVKPNWDNYDGPRYTSSEEEEAAEKKAQEAQDASPLTQVHEEGLREVKDGEAVEPKAKDEQSDEGEEFDPNKHKVKDVLAYLESADDAERERVLEAEKKSGNRASIVKD